MRKRFLGLSEQESPFFSSQVVILPISYEATTSYLKGARKVPHKILQASEQLEFYEEELNWQPSQIGIYTLPVLKLKSNPARMVEKIYKKINEVLSFNKFPIFLGGEHTISFPIVKALKDRGTEFSLVQLDAHLDLRDTYQKTEFSHACVMRRISELDIPICAVGVRSFSKKEVDYLNQNPNYIFFSMNNIRQDKNWLVEFLSKLKQEVYLSIDFDVFDPSVFPSVGTPEPGGFTWQEGLECIKNIAFHKTIIGADFVELTVYPGIEYSYYSAAKLIYKLISYCFYPRYSS
ncbi:MAG: agmatinase [Candidatus Aminicenantia bacterium]